MKVCINLKSAVITNLVKQFVSFHDKILLIVFFLQILFPFLLAKAVYGDLSSTSTRRTRSAGKPKPALKKTGTMQVTAKVHSYICVFYIYIKPNECGCCLEV